MVWSLSGRCLVCGAPWFYDKMIEDIMASAFPKAVCWECGYVGGEGWYDPIPEDIGDWK